MNFRLLVFDWDGTLMDSEARIVACMRSALADVGCAPQPDGAIRNIIGLGLTEAIAELLPGEPERTRVQVGACYRERFLSREREPSPMFDGARETLNHLVDAGYLLAVATGKSRRGLERELQSTGLKSLFHATRCADEAFSKPHPEMLEQIMDQLGARPAQTLMIGDTEYDMQMAANAGARGLGVTFGVHTPERLLQHRALHCVESLPEIPGWLQQLQAGAAVGL
jgi:phosphoglycolate phosphatase